VVDDEFVGTQPHHSTRLQRRQDWQLCQSACPYNRRSPVPTTLGPGEAAIIAAFCTSTTVLYLRPNALNLRDECGFGGVEWWTTVVFCLRVGSDEISAFYEVISPRLFRSGSEIEMPTTRRSAEVRKSCFRFGLYADVNDDCACLIIWREKWHPYVVSTDR
jgi:hypothetical protein